MTQSITNVRRYYLQKRQTSAEVGDRALELVWTGKQLAEPGTALPAGFPHTEDLAAVGYVAVEDLDGADCRELRDMGLTDKQADEVLAAFAAL